MSKRNSPAVSAITPVAISMLLAASLVLPLGGCSNLRFPGVYRIDIEQGNIVTPEMLGKLKAGMTEAQVRFVMGSPQLTDPFEAGRWVYLYRLRKGNGQNIESKVVLWLENGALTRWEGEALPESARRLMSTAAAATNTATTPDATAPVAAE